VEIVSASVTTEAELARVMRERAELSQRYDERHPELAKAAATETALRQAASVEDRSQFRRALIHALSDQLADAMRERREVAARFGDGPEMRAAQGVVLTLTTAINREVNSAS
jgi:hypothetical protein